MISAVPVIWKAKDLGEPGTEGQAAVYDEEGVETVPAVAARPARPASFPLELLPTDATTPLIDELITETQKRTLASLLANFRTAS